MTNQELWTNPHMSEQMLAYHLNETVDAASRNHAFLNTFKYDDELVLLDKYTIVEVEQGHDGLFQQAVKRDES